MTEYMHDHPSDSTAQASALPQGSAKQRKKRATQLQPHSKLLIPVEHATWRREASASPSWENEAPEKVTRAPHLLESD